MEDSVKSYISEIEYNLNKLDLENKDNNLVAYIECIFNLLDEIRFLIQNNANYYY